MRYQRVNQQSLVSGEGRTLAFKSGGNRSQSSCHAYKTVALPMVELTTCSSEHLHATHTRPWRYRWSNSQHAVPNIRYPCRRIR